MIRVLSYCLFVILLGSCSVHKYLKPGEALYRGASIKVQKDKEVKTSSRSLKKQLKKAIRLRSNKFLLGSPYKVWWWYTIGETEKQKGLKYWLRKKLGEPPVFSNRVNTALTSQTMQSYLENTGFFHSTVIGDTNTKNNFTKAVYRAHVLPQYKIKSVTWISDSSQILKDLSDRKKRSLLKPGKPYQLSNIDEERSRLDLRLKKKGYYFFNPTYILAYADSTVGDRKVDLFLNLRSTTPENAKHPFSINRIIIFPNYTLIDPPPDTSRFGLTPIDSLLIRDTVYKFKPELFKRTVTYRPGRLYSSNDQNATLNRFINLGVFKFVKNRFDVVKDTAHPYLLNAYYYLTPAKKKSIQAEIDGFSKENKYIGTQLSLNWKNRNTFKGAEQLAFKVYGGLEVSLSDSIKNNDNYKIGAQASISVPRFVVPFFTIKEAHLYPPRTELLLAYEFFIKQSLYTKNIFQFQYLFDWKESSNKQHSFAPISLAYSFAKNVTDSFYKQAQLNPSILINVDSQAILGTFYNYTYKTLNPFARNQWYFNGGVDLSGNIAGWITGAKHVKEKTIFKTPFAQFVKFDIDLRYKTKGKNKMEWANRLQVGLGFPYDNSNVLPFSKQYIIGGANSLRGFPARSIGPGTHVPSADDIRYYQVIGGDYKLLLNSEIRIPFSKKLSGAVFVDMGNIWTKDSLLFGTAGQIKKDWYKEIAVSTGFGLRFDMSVLILRVDLGIPLRKPYLPDGSRWVFNKIDFSDGRWRSENLILNIAIGMPF
jgi:outer membrane protein assembly factor BamA